MSHYQGDKGTQGSPGDQGEGGPEGDMGDKVSNSFKLTWLCTSSFTYVMCDHLVHPLVTMCNAMHEATTVLQ